MRQREYITKPVQSRETIGASCDNCDKILTLGYAKTINDAYEITVEAAFYEGAYMASDPRTTLLCTGCFTQVCDAFPKANFNNRKD